MLWGSVILRVPIVRNNIWNACNILGIQTIIEGTKKITHMENIFSKDNVTVIRKKGDSYYRKVINTAPVLPGAAQDRDRIRTGVIDRLRKDPSVILVLEDRGGRADERVSLRDGFEMAVSLVDGETPSASLTIFHRGETAFEDEFTQDPDETGYCTVPGDLVESAIDILSCIDGKDYSFVSDSCTHFARVEPSEDIDIYLAKHILDEEGFQTESVRTVGSCAYPVLFVHENEVVLLGSRRFGGETLYLEMKRLFVGVLPEVVRGVVEKVRHECRPVEIIERDDCSWSFRLEMDDDTDVDNYMEKLLACLSTIRDAIALVEKEDGIGEELWSIMEDQRQLFIYETIDSSVKLNNLNI